MQRKYKNRIYEHYIDNIKPKIITNNITTTGDEFLNIDVLNESQINDIVPDLYNKMIIFDTNQYLEKIVVSYNNNINNIIQQFQSDHARSEVFFNNNKIHDSKDFTEKILKYSSFPIKLCSNIFSLDIIILMLCTQASFVFSFILINKLYTNYKNGKHVTSNKSQYYINIKNPDIIDIKLDAIYLIKDVNKNIIVSKVNVVTNITAVYKKKQYEFCKWGIINWNFI